MSEYSRATIDDVAEKAGVSIATVSRVINKTGQVSEATTIRVWDAIAALDYSPHAAARGLASRRTNTIGLILQDISGEFFSPMLRGIEAGTREYGFDLLIHCTHAAENAERRAQDQCSHQQAEPKAHSCGRRRIDTFANGGRLGGMHERVLGSLRVLWRRVKSRGL